MQTHEDFQHDNQFLKRLRERAEKAADAGTSQMTAGRPQEESLGAWVASNGMHVNHLPNDEQDILRISIGGGDHLPVTLNYATIRGGVGQCIGLLEKAIVALRECPE